MRCRRTTWCAIMSPKVQNKKGAVLGHRPQKGEKTMFVYLISQNAKFRKRQNGSPARESFYPSQLRNLSRLDSRPSFGILLNGANPPNRLNRLNFCYHWEALTLHSWDILLQPETSGGINEKPRLVSAHQPGAGESLFLSFHKTQTERRNRIMSFQPKPKGGRPAMTLPKLILKPKPKPKPKGGTVS